MQLTYFGKLQQCKQIVTSTTTGDRSPVKGRDMYYKKIWRMKSVLYHLVWFSLRKQLTQLTNFIGEEAVKRVRQPVGVAHSPPLASLEGLKPLLTRRKQQPGGTRRTFEFHQNFLGHYQYLK